MTLDELIAELNAVAGIKAAARPASAILPDGVVLHEVTVFDHRPRGVTDPLAKNCSLYRRRVFVVTDKGAEVALPEQAMLDVLPGDDALAATRFQVLVRERIKNNGLAVRVQLFALGVSAYVEGVGPGGKFAKIWSLNSAEDGIDELDPPAEFSVDSPRAR